MILEKTVELLIQIFKTHKILPPKVNRIVIGKSYTGVELATFFYGMVLGLAYNLHSVREDINNRKKEFTEDTEKFSLKELLKWSHDTVSLEKIIGIATLNALSQNALKFLNPYEKIRDDLISYLKIDKDTRVTFIGCIKPMIRKISDITKLITIIDDNKHYSEEFSQFNTKRHISQLKDKEINTDILICTGTAIANDTIEEVLEYFQKKSRKIAVIGPTASIIPDFLFDYGVDIVGGMRIKDSEATIKILQEGGGTKLFKQYGKKYNLIRYT